MVTQSAAAEGDVAATATAIFASFDRDGSGSITYSEFRDGLRQFGVDISEEDMTVLVQELDRDQSGDISLAEFKNLLLTTHKKEHEAH